MNQDPVVPAVASFDPVEWTRKIEGMSRRINDLEGDKQQLQAEVDQLRGKLAQQTSAAATARGVMKPLKEEVEALRGKLAASENLKELAQLRAEIAKAHASAAVLQKAAAEREGYVKAQIQDLGARAARAESKFQSLEGTASMMASSRDKANAAAAALLVERDAALKMVEALKEDNAQGQAEFVKLRADLEKATAEAKALRKAPQAETKAK